MAYRDKPDCVVPPSHLRCEAMTKPVENTYQVWLRESHRCVRRSVQCRGEHSVCALHARAKKVTYWSGEADAFPHKRFWKWPRKLAELAAAMALATNGGKWDDGHYCEDHKALWMKRAAAAIEAMREPTDLMRVVGNRHLNFHPSERAAEIAFTAMIDAALQEKP